MPLDWVDCIDYNGVTFSVELLGGVRDRAALCLFKIYFILVVDSYYESLRAFLRSTSSLWCTRTMRASVKIHLAPLRDLIKKPELLWYNVLLFFYLLRDRSLFIAWGGRGKDLGLNKVKFSRSPL